MKPWSGPPPGASDPRLRALSYAVLAPNAHNTQPWSLALRGDDEILLYVDRTRLLPQTDVPFRQAHVSQGTFLELLVIALSAMGRRADVTLFPEGEYGNDTIDDRPVARVRVTNDFAARDPLFAHITTRRSNKREYDLDRKPTAAQIAALSGSVAAGARLAVIENAAARERLTNIATDGMAAEVKDRGRNEETAKWFRYSGKELEQKRDGFGLANNGKTGFTAWFAETFVLSREGSADPNGTFARGAIDMARSQANSASAFGVLTTASNTRTAQVFAGRAYARVALTAQALGLSMHPMSQSLEEYADMAQVKARMEREVMLAPGSTVQMLFRLGYADPTPHTPRRSVEDMVRRS
jgi:nitroreductase